MQTYSESQKNPHEAFLTFSPNGWKFLVQFLQAYYTFLSTLVYKFLFPSVTKLCHIKCDCATTQRAFRPMVEILSI